MSNCNTLNKICYARKKLTNGVSKDMGWRGLICSNRSGGVEIK